MKLNKKGMEKWLLGLIIMLLVLAVITIGAGGKLIDLVKKTGDTADSITADIDGDGVRNPSDMCCCKLPENSDIQIDSVTGCPLLESGKAEINRCPLNPSENYEVPECKI